MTPERRSELGAWLPNDKDSGAGAAIQELLAEVERLEVDLRITIVRGAHEGAEALIAKAAVRELCAVLRNIRRTAVVVFAQHDLYLVKQADAVLAKYDDERKDAP